MNKAAKLIGIIAAVVVFVLICIPIIKTFSDKTTKTALSGAVTNSCTEYLSVDTDHVAHPKDLIFVFDGKVAKIINNDMRNIIFLDEYKDIPRVQIGAAVTEDALTYTEGTYMSRVEDGNDYYVVNIAAGDSLAGLYPASDIYTFDGFAFYGHLERCDVYVSMR